MQKLRSVQVLRAVAVLGVLVAHAKNWDRGGAGVDLFFVISGVIIGTVMVRRTAKEFFVARLWRIYPIYWFNLLPLLAAAAVGGIITPARLASSLTLWPVWGSYSLPYLLPAWTLCFEMLFYSLVAAGLAVGRPRLVIPILACLIALNLSFGGPLLQFIGNPLVAEFCAGLLILKLPRHRAAGVAAIAAAVVLFAVLPVVSVSAIALLDPAVAFERALTSGLPAALLVYGALCLEGSFTRWATPAVFIGDASYSIYLSQLLANLALDLALPVWWPLRVSIMLAWGCAMYLFAERPMIAWAARRRSSNLSPAAGVRSKSPTRSAAPLAPPA